MPLSALLKKYNLSPKKGLGQNFLSNPFHLQKIVDAAELTVEDTVLEVGPGPGLLTQLLAQQAGRVIAVELDENMVNLLHTEYSHLPNLTVIHADILQTQLDSLLQFAQDSSKAQSQIINQKSKIKVVANLPYYITSAAIRHLLESRPQPQRLVVTIQKEVAQRIVARPGQMSVLAVSVQFYGAPALVHHIPAGAFYPPPKVDSAVVRIDTHAGPPIEGVDANQFFQVVKAGFSQKRKQLKNTLSSGLRLPAVEVVQALNAAGIEPSRRAQTLSLEEWGRLVKELG